MAINCKVEMSGFLGKDAKTVSHKNGSFIVLSIATTDSYPLKNEKTGEVVWKDKETVWHEIIVFRAQAAHFARDLKKGDAVAVSGTISYRTFKDAEGYNRKQASIVASFVEKIHYEKQEELLPREYGSAVDAALDDE